MYKDFVDIFMKTCSVCEVEMSFSHCDLREYFTKRSGFYGMVTHPGPY